MWFDGQRQPNTIYVANTSRGKDSTAMLRAIQLMGWPLDAIVSVDIWFDEDTPAELPPMVAFKDEYDRKVLDLFGVPVTRICAHKRERERELPTADSSITGNIQSDTDGTSTDSQSNGSRGANRSKTKSMVDSRLTYCDIFYRKIHPRRERERAVCESTDSQSSTGTGATPISNNLSYGIPKSELPLVYRRTQEQSSINGFPARHKPWCNNYFKATP